MASVVFGNPITNSTFLPAMPVFGNPRTNSTSLAMPKYPGKVITRKDRAHVALNRKNAENKDVNARAFVNKIKAEHGGGVSPESRCRVYNGTGNTVNYVTKHSWSGDFKSSPIPDKIENGEWVEFSHVIDSHGTQGSAGAVVYRGKDSYGIDYDWMFSWNNPRKRTNSDNKVYTEIREEGHYDKHDYWDYIRSLLNKSDTIDKDNWNGCSSGMITGHGTTIPVEGIMTLEDA